MTRRNPLTIVRGISWEVLPLVAGLFVLVEAIDKAGAIGVLSNLLRAAMLFCGSCRWLLERCRRCRLQRHERTCRLVSSPGRRRLPIIFPRR